MRLFHGSKKIVSMPICDHNNDKSDFGRGFYATESEELAREWAVPDIDGGFLNVFELDTEDLNIVDLCRSDRDINEWFSLICLGRIIPFYSRKEADFCQQIIKDHLPDIENADIIKGYRADSSSFSLCRAYISGDIKKDQLSEILKNDNYGEEVLIRTEKAFNKLEYEGFETVEGSLYFPRRMMRDIRLKSNKSEMSCLSGISYSKAFLSDAMRCLGELMEYASLAAPELSSDHILKLFTISGLASRFENGDPFIISGMSGPELFFSIMEKCNEYRYHRPAPGIFPANDKVYKCGSLLAYFQWISLMSFEEIINALPFARLDALYPEFSDLSLNEAAVIIDKRIRERRSSQTKLQTYRKRLSLSQKELAALSGVNLRTLQQYETGDKDINRAASDKAGALSRALHCSQRQLIEPNLKLFH